jgi:cyclopropane fatty-acyl-phospholipid synthase-like methyltransferase
MKNTDFYNSISAFYDNMIDFNSSVIAKKKFFLNFINENYKTVIDLGCGSGSDSIPLASLGLQVTAFDNSINMLKWAKANSIKYNQKINFIQSDIAKSIDKLSKADLIVSMGNTFANIPQKSLSRIFKNVYRSLNAGGSFLFQVLNYYRILHEKERLIGITENQNSIYVRFYDFEKDSFGFNILSIKKSDLKNAKLFTTRIYPHSKGMLIKTLKSAGFIKTKVYGSLSKENFHEKKSKDLIVYSIK